MAKRTAANDLNRDNWQDQDAEESDEMGVFKQASEATMRERVIKKAKRRGETEHRDEPLIPIFNNFTAFNTKPMSAPQFSFGLNNKAPSFPSFPSLNKQDGKKISADSIKSIIGAVVNKCDEVENVSQIKTPEIIKSKFSFLSSQELSIDKNMNASKPSESRVASSLLNSDTTPKISSSENLYYANLKALNLGVLKWIQQHVDKNPYINLIPIFDDYKKFLSELKEKHQHGKNNSAESFISNIVSVGSEVSSKEANVSQLMTGSTSMTKPTFSFGTSTAFTSGSNFSFGVKNTPPILVNNSPVKKLDTITTTASGSSQERLIVKEGEPSDEVPENDVEVKEEGSVYDKKVKLFYKEKEKYALKGVGILFLKPAGEKTQMIVRALTSLGNILLNIVLNSSIPAQRLGKNNVLIMCVPNPPLDPKSPDNTPISMLIRVKTAVEADELLEKIEEHKK